MTCAASARLPGELLGCKSAQAVPVIENVSQLFHPCPNPEFVSRLIGLACAGIATMDNITDTNRARMWPMAGSFEQSTDCGAIELPECFLRNRVSGAVALTLSPLKQ